MAERDEGGLLARWSQRKAAARRGELEPEAEAAAGDAPAEHAGTGADAAVADQPAPELPDPDTLDASADFKAFLKPGVPPELRTRALRRLWSVNPVYNRLDGLDDYCEDYTDQARVVRNLKTVYRVGRGMIERITEAADAGPPPPAPAAPAESAPPPAPSEHERETAEFQVDEESIGAAGMAGSPPSDPVVEPLQRQRLQQQNKARRLPRRG